MEIAYEYLHKGSRVPTNIYVGVGACDDPFGMLCFPELPKKHRV